LKHCRFAVQWTYSTRLDDSFYSQNLTTKLGTRI